MYQEYASVAKALTGIYPKNPKKMRKKRYENSNI